MALVTNQMQISYATLDSRPSSWSKGMKRKQYMTLLRMVDRADTFISLKHNRSLSVGAPYIRASKFKLLRLSAFKGSTRNDDSGGRANGPKVSKNSVKVKDGDDYLTRTPRANHIPLSYTSETNEDTATSPAIHKLFKKWLTVLCSHPPSQKVDGILEELPTREILETEHESHDKGRANILKVFWFYFLGLDTMIKIPLMIFIPLYLAVNVFYGAVVSKELTPLWVIGPFILALYIKMLHWLCSLYVFTFKQTVKIVKNVPTYYKVAYSYVASGKLKEEVRARLWQPIINIKNLDYKELSRRKFKELEECIVEKYLDFVESIWPFYCRTIRFLKRANLI